MAQIIKELRVDVSQPNVFQAIVAKQHDSNSRFLKITLVNFGVKIEVPNTAKVTINANRPDGASESFKGEANNDGTITVPLAQWMLDIDGEVKCDVSVTNTEDNKRLTSTDFWLEVQKAANPNASIPLDPDGEILIIKPVTEINENSKDTDYPSAKAVYDLDNITATATGNAITVESAKAPLQNLKLFGKTTQNGTPTPEAPVPMVSVGDSGSFEVGVFGKNLLKYPYASGDSYTKNGITFTVNADKSITVNGTSTANATYMLSYTLEFGVLNEPLYVHNIKEGSGSGTTLIVHYKFDGKDQWTASTIPIGAKIVEVYLEVANGKTISNAIVKPMITTNATETDYEPPKAKQTLTMPYPLRSYGGVQDEIDFARGVLLQRCILLKDFAFNYEKTNVNAYHSAKPYPMSYSGALCNYSAQYKADESDNTHHYIGGGSVWVFLPKTIDTSVASDIEVLGVLETPIEIPLTETELNAYRQLYTNKGTTTILSEADMEVDYYINKPNAQAIGNIHSQVNKDYLKLQQAIISTGGSTL